MAILNFIDVEKIRSANVLTMKKNFLRIKNILNDMSLLSASQGTDKRL